MRDTNSHSIFKLYSSETESSVVMARSLDKVHKKISRKRGAKINSLHENSRDAGRLRAAGAREEKLSRLMDAAARSNRVYGTGYLSAN